MTIQEKLDEIKARAEKAQDGGEVIELLPLDCGDFFIYRGTKTKEETAQFHLSSRDTTLKLVAALEIAMDFINVHNEPKCKCDWCETERKVAKILGASEEGK